MGSTMVSSSQKRQVLSSPCATVPHRTRVNSTKLHSGSLKFTALLAILLVSVMALQSGSPLLRLLRHNEPSDRDLLQLLDVASLRENVRVTTIVTGRSSRDAALRARAAALAARFPRSLIAAYERVGARCAARPLRKHVVAAVDAVLPSREHELVVRDLVASVPTASPTRRVLLVFYDASNNDDAGNLGRGFMGVVEQFSHAVFLRYVASDAPLGATDQVLDTIAAEGKLQVTRVASRGLEADLKLVRAAQFVLLHGGEVAALAALAAGGRTYMTDSLYDYASNDEFRWMVKDLQPATKKTVESMLFTRHARAAETFAAMGPVEDTCCQFRGFGIGDQEKVVCENADGLRRKNCWVMSVGCGNKWQFEEDIVKKTGCDVHVFDCTSVFRVPRHLQTRVKFHHVCLGAPGDTRSAFQSWRELLALGSEKGGKITMPVIAKMDIEGFEFPVLLDLLKEKDNALLPKQMVIEIHERTNQDVGPPFILKAPPPRAEFRVNVSSVQSLFNGLAARGFVLTHRSDNPFCPHCTEVELVQRSALPPGV